MGKHSSRTRLVQIPDCPRHSRQTASNQTQQKEVVTCSPSNHSPQYKKIGIFMSQYWVILSKQIDSSELETTIVPLLKEHNWQVFEKQWFSPYFLTKHNQNLARSDNLLSLKSRSTIHVNWAFYVPSIEWIYQNRDIFELKTTKLPLLKSTWLTGNGKAVIFSLFQQRLELDKIFIDKDHLQTRQVRSCW